MTKRVVATFAAVLLVGYLFAQSSNGRKIVFHVTSVEQADASDWCESGKCSATRFTVGGHAADGDAVIEYVLECVEVVASEPKHPLTLQCVRVHAHYDYDATLFADAIFFESQPNTPPSGSDKPATSAYTIKSEKEVRKR